MLDQYVVMRRADHSGAGLASKPGEQVADCARVRVDCPPLSAVVWASVPKITPGRECLERVAVGGVVEPGADHDRPELGLRLEAERRIEVLAIVGLQADVLAGHLFKQVPDHCRGDSSPSVRRGGPDVKQVRVANPVREQPRHSDDPVAVASERNMLRLLERATGEPPTPSVIELIRRQIGLRLHPVDALQRTIDPHRHKPTIARNRLQDLDDVQRAPSVASVRNDARRTTT